MPKRVLLIDDAETVLFAFSRLLSVAGFRVECARELEEAEALVSHVAYDLVIADLSLDGALGREGLEIVRFVRRHCRTVPIILITASPSPALEREAYQRGADGFLAKTRPASELVRLAAALSGAER